MKHLKIFSLVAVAAASLMALSAGTASADEVTSPAGTTAKKMVWSLVAETSAKLVNTTNQELLTCTKGESTHPIVSQGPGFPLITAPVEYDLGNCTLPAQVLKAGGEEIDAPTGSPTATVKATSESQLTIATVLFGSCIYGATAGTTIGSVNTSSGELTVNAITEKFSNSAFACPVSTKWVANWVLTVPNPYLFDEN